MIAIAAAWWTAAIERGSLGQGEVQVGESMRVLDLGRVAPTARFVTCANGTISNGLVS